MKDSAVDQRIQDSFVLLAISDTKFLQAARKSIQSSYFGSQITQDIVSICYTFFDQFGIAPENHFRDEVIKFLAGKSKEDSELYMIYLERLKELDLPNPAYVISRINTFVQARELEKGAVELARLAKDGNFEKARQLMQKTLRAGIVQEEVGLKYFENGLPSYLQPHRSNQRLIGIGMPYIDQRFPRGFCRTDFLCILGGYKGCKSWCCIYLGIQGLLSGLKVLHITHELSLEDTEMRYDMGLGGLVGEPSRTVETISLETLGEDESPGIFENFDLPTVGNAEEVKTCRRKIGRLGGELIIRKYPMGSCTMGEIYRYLDYLESFEGFVPDIFINDYVEKMKIPPSDKRNDIINDIYINMKGIADDRKLLAVTVSQVPREALRKMKLDEKDFAEDIRKLGNTDQVIAISATEEMFQNHRMLVWFMANRHGPMKFVCKIAQNLEIGQFCLKSWPYVPVYKKSRGEENDKSLGSK